MSVEYNEQGYVAQRPLPPAQWSALCPDQPTGVMMALRAAPPGVIVVRDFLPAELCARIVAECEQRCGEPAPVHTNEPGENLTADWREGRISENVQIDGLSVDFNLIVRNAFSDLIGPHFRAHVESFEKPEILRYRAGGRYIPHSDAENWNADERRWRRVADRDLSLLLYLNGDFEGGELFFPNFGFGLSPQPGLLVGFPSDNRYLHAARPVTKGVRYAVVSWAQMRGSPRVERERRSSIIDI